jgi:hypothetical protein
MKANTNATLSACLLAGLLGLCFAPALRGDTWMLPAPVTVSSPSGKYIAQVTPGAGGYFGDFESAITNRAQNATVILSVRPQPGITNVVWSGKLINPAAPVEVFVSDDGYLVTMDNWHQVGYGPVVAIYDPKGNLVRHWSLEELFSSEEQRELTRSVSSIWWHKGPAHFGNKGKTNIFVVPAVGKTFKFDLTKGTPL